MNITMKILPEREIDENGFSWSLNETTINDFCEINLMSEDYWTRMDYERQWKNGLARIKIHDTSCLVISTQHPKKNKPFVNWWVLFKEGDQIIINNRIIIEDSYTRLIGNKNFSPDNCYDFIEPRRKKSKISEWIVEL